MAISGNGPIIITYLIKKINILLITENKMKHICKRKISIYSFCLLSWRRQWQATPVLLPRKSQGWRSLAGCSPWDRCESDTTERLHFHFHALEKEMATRVLQCSCLENPRDGGSWWAAVHGVPTSG